MSIALMEAHELSASIAGRRIVERLSFSLDAGQRLAILGRNGAGKTTLLHTLAGLRTPAAGTVTLAGAPLAALGGREAARRRGLLLQHQMDAFPATVLETALIGRHPHLHRWDWESADDERIARASLTALGLAALAERDVRSLSGGERQRLAIAALLAQQPRVYLLDEPLAHLDLNHQMAVLELFARQAREEGIGVIVVMHDVNLALRYADRALLLDGEGGWHEGAVADVLTAPALSGLYGYPLREVHAEGHRYFMPE